VVSFDGLKISCFTNIGNAWAQPAGCNQAILCRSACLVGWRRTCNARHVNYIYMYTHHISHLYTAAARRQAPGGLIVWNTAKTQWTTCAACSSRPPSVDKQQLLFSAMPDV
jgi:hypothetical protein